MSPRIVKRVQQDFTKVKHGSSGKVKVTMILNVKEWDKNNRKILQKYLKAWNVLKDLLSVSLFSWTCLPLFLSRLVLFKIHVQKRSYYYFWTGWTGSRVTENNASMSALRLELFLARIAAGVRHEPRVKGWVNFLATVALVSGRNALLGVGVTTFRTAPLKYLLLTTTLDYDGRK